MPRKARSEDTTMKPVMYDVVVSDDIRTFFQSAIMSGTGGFQSLGRILKDQLARGNALRIDEQTFRRVVRYGEHYGDGGFQTKMRKIAVQWLDQNFSKVAKALNA